MKKYIIALILLSCTFGVSYATNVLVTAKVGNLNSRPIIINVNPNSNPNILEANEIVNYTIYFKDEEKDKIDYTITPQYGGVDIINGVIHSGAYDSSSGAYLNFRYIAPSISPDENTIPNESILITLDDGGKTGSGVPRITSEKINIYVY